MPRHRAAARTRRSHLLEQLAAEYERPERGLSIREVAGGFRMTTKPEHHEAVRRFVRNLNPPLKLSLPALETLAVIAYKQPITAPEIMEIRGVQGAGVLKTLLDRKLIAAAGRKTGDRQADPLQDHAGIPGAVRSEGSQELPTLKEFQEIGRSGTGRRAGRRPCPGRSRSKMPAAAEVRCADQPNRAEEAEQRIVPEERLQKILSAAGIASRRKAEQLILEGRVTVNGQIVTELGTKADLERDHIKVDGKLIRQPDASRLHRAV